MALTAAIGGCDSGESPEPRIEARKAQLQEDAEALADAAQRWCVQVLDAEEIEIDDGPVATECAGTTYSRPAVGGGSDFDLDTCMQEARDSFEEIAGLICNATFWNEDACLDKACTGRGSQCVGDPGGIDYGTPTCFHVEDELDWTYNCHCVGDVTCACECESCVADP